MDAESEIITDLPDLAATIGPTFELYITPNHLAIGTVPADNVYTKLETHKLSHCPNLVPIALGLVTEVPTGTRCECTVLSFVDRMLTD